FKEPSNTPIYTNEVGDSIVIPDEGPWRFGKPSEFSSFIFMKFAYRSNGTQKNHHHSS
ncbi:Putative LOC100122304, partial [Caligus rogercresseyi]